MRGRGHCVPLDRHRRCLEYCPKLWHGLQSAGNGQAFFQILQVAPDGEIGSGGIDCVSELVDVSLFLRRPWTALRHHPVPCFQYGQSARASKCRHFLNFCLGALSPLQEVVFVLFRSRECSFRNICVSRLAEVFPVEASEFGEGHNAVVSTEFLKEYLLERMGRPCQAGG